MISKAMTRSKHWKIVSGILIIILFLSLYSFIYTQIIELPSENWSKGILIDSFKSKIDYKNLNETSSIALTLDNKSLINLYANNNEVIINTYDLSGTLTNTKNIPLEDTITSIKGYVKDNNITLLAYSDSNHCAYHLKIKGSDFSIIKASKYDLSTYKVNLSNNLIIAFNQSTIRVIGEEEEHIFKENLSGHIELADALYHNNKLIVATAYNDRGVHRVGKLVTSNGAIDEYIYNLSPINSIKPVHLILNENREEVEMLITMHNMKTNSKYLEYFRLNNDLTMSSHNLYKEYNYDATPYIVEGAGPDLYIYNIQSKSMGRTEIDRGMTRYPNLYISSNIEGIAKKQITKSTLTSYSPSYITVGGYNYLIYTEYEDETLNIYMASDNPHIIEMSKGKDPKLFTEVFTRTLLNYPALIFTSLIASIYIVLPVILLAGILLLIKLHWFDKSRNVSIALFVVYTISKISLYATSVFKEHAYALSLPNYLKPSLNHWGAFILLSLLTAYVGWNRLKTSKDKENYLRALIIYIILDMVVINLFFLPYKII